MTRSQLHKGRVQGVTSDGVSTLVTVANALVDQTSSVDTPDSYQFASNSFASVDGALRYDAKSVVNGAEVALVAGLTFTESTRTFNWTLGAGTKTVRVFATNGYGNRISDDFTITVS